MSTHKICFCREIRKLSAFRLTKASYLELLGICIGAV